MFILGNKDMYIVGKDMYILLFVIMLFWSCMYLYSANNDVGSQIRLRAERKEATAVMDGKPRILFLHNNGIILASSYRLCRMIGLQIYAGYPEIKCRSPLFWQSRLCPPPQSSLAVMAIPLSRTRIAKEIGIGMDSPC
jgi:hypothetical protein